MIRILGSALVLISSLLMATSSFATIQQRSLPLGMTIEYVIPKNEPLEFENIFYWTISANCSIKNDSDPDGTQYYITATMVRKSGIVNGQKLTKGSSNPMTPETMGFVLSKSDNLNIIAEAGSRVRLTNTGETVIKASCSSY